MNSAIAGNFKETFAGAKSIMSSRRYSVGLCLLLFGLAAAPGLAVDEGAKGMFYKQMNSPAAKLNTGVQYWIELKRGSEVLQVSNKFEFRSGDRIRFHVKPNTDCYAYVMLKEGSRGEQAVLFPDSRHADDNRFKAGVDYTVPDDGFLTFDANPGVEKVVLLLSRAQINADKFLKDHTNEHVLIASRESGSKDLVPGSVVVGFNDPQPANLPELPASPKLEKKEENAVTTVVHKDPTAVLALDVILTHRQ